MKDDDALRLRDQVYDHPNYKYSQKGLKMKNLKRKIKGTLIHKFNEYIPYHPARFWEKRFKNFPPNDFRGVGHIKKETPERYEENVEQIKNIVNYSPGDRVLEIGSGNFFYFKKLFSVGYYYMAIDITDIYAKWIGLPKSMNFIRWDITQPLTIWPKFDLILMIDVTQHITSQRKFVKAMRNVKHLLADGGQFVVTTMDSREFKSYYVRDRRLIKYKQVLEPLKLKRIEPFRDKYIAVFK